VGNAALLGLLLVPSLWFVMTIAGPDAWSLQGLRDAPFSPAGETLLAALLLPASLVLAGVWPFGFLTNGPRFAPLAALLLVVVLVPMVGEGLEHWRSLYAGWLVLAAFVAAATANWPRVMACAGLFAIACGGATASWSGTSLTIIASLLSLRPATSRPLGRLACLAAGACGMAALQATLAHEVVYSVLMLLAVVLGVLRDAAPPGASCLVAGEHRRYALRIEGEDLVVLRRSALHAGEPVTMPVPRDPRPSGVPSAVVRCRPRARGLLDHIASHHRRVARRHGIGYAQLCLDGRHAARVVCHHGKSLFPEVLDHLVQQPQLGDL
jgi:hypothetical protein